MRQSKLSVTQVWDDRITISDPTAERSAVYRYDTALAKPCFHPLTTPAGHLLSGFQMSDHVWHRGLWFAIKFINGTNFWEEHAPFGIQCSIEQPACELRLPDRVRITHAIEWTSQATGPVIRENRSMEYHWHASGFRSIDWSAELNALEDLTLDRTPYTTWGGYGGLAFRGSRELHDTQFLLPSGETATSVAGQPHDWVMMHAAVDGGPGLRVAIGIIDHPSNPRSPSPWYCKSGNGFNYMNPAFLFNEPLVLKKEQALRFRYRIFYRDGVWTAAEFQSLADEFRKVRRL